MWPHKTFYRMLLAVLVTIVTKWEQPSVHQLTNEYMQRGSTSMPWNTTQHGKGMEGWNRPRSERTLKAWCSVRPPRSICIDIVGLILISLILILILIWICIDIVGSHLYEAVVTESILAAVGGWDWGESAVTSSGCGTVETRAVPRNPYRWGWAGVPDKRVSVTPSHITISYFQLYYIYYYV